MRSSDYLHGTHDEEQSRLSKLNVLLNDKCLDVLKLRGSERILDIGSGLGQFSQQMAEAVVNNGGSVLGIERSEDQLRKAQEFLNKRKQPLDNIQFRQGSAYDLPLTQDEIGSFDVAFCRFVLEHLQRPQDAVRTMHKAVKVGGRVVLVDDDHAHFTLYPEAPGFEFVWTQYCRIYDRLGNDPYVGRRLISLIYEAGFAPHHATSVFFGAHSTHPHFHLYCDNLIGILAGAKDQMIDLGLINDHQFTTCIDALKQWSELKDATLWYSIPWAEGLKE